MVPVNRRQLSLYDEAKAGFSSLLRQTTVVFVSFVVILLLTGGAPSSFAIALSFCSGIAFVAWSEQRRITKLRDKDTTNSSGNIKHKRAVVTSLKAIIRLFQIESFEEDVILLREFKQKLEDLEAQYQAKLRAHQAELRAHDERIALLMAQLAQLPIKVKVTAGEAMSHSTDSSRKIEIENIGGDFNASGSALNLGDISGTITNTLHQLQTANHPNALQLADLLKQLQIAINDEPDLPPEDKAEALTEVNVLAEAGKNPQKETQQKKANTALEILKNTIAALTPTAALVKACSELLPAIAKLLGP
jgi:hypothetical protein